METGKRTRGRSKTISVTNAVNVNVATVPATTNSELNGENIVQKDNSDAVNSAEKEVTSFKEVEQPEEEEKSKKDAEEIVEEIVSEHENEIESVANKDSESFTNKDRESPTNKDSESFINKDSELFTNKDSESFTNKGSESVIDQDIESVNDKENESIKVKGRKRKVSEVKFDESSLDEPNSKVTKEVIESESSFENLDDSADQSEPNSDLHLPPKQTLGKGKRARIPNKRYSDIAISPPPKAGKFLFENGKDFEKFESDVSSPASQEEIVPAPAVTTLKARTSSSSPLPKKQKMSVDLTHPNYLKPFNIGWKRELVWRATTDPSSNKRNGDIYYYTPAGKKLRSMREVSENLKNKELTLEDFTFFKEPIGLDDPEKEIIRDAKFKVGSGGGAKKLLTPKPKPKIMSPKIMSPKLPTPKVSRVSLPRTAITKNKSKSVEDVPHPNTETVESKPEVKTPKSKSTSNFKVKITPKAKAEKKAKLEAKQLDAAIAEELLMTGKKPTPKKPAKWAQKPVTSESPPKPMKKSKRVNNMIAIGDKKEDSKFMDNYLQNLSYGYNTLLYVFQYLKVQDLLRAGCVCTMWRDIASHSLLWRTVRMKNSQVHSFEGLANTLQKHGTVQLDLRKMLLTNCDEIWPEFSNNIGKVDTLRKIELCRCPASVVENLTETNEKLEVINAVTIRCETMSLDGLAQLGNLRELRLKSTTGLTLKTDIESLQSLVNLKHLSLTSIRDLNTMKLDVIAELNNLESLDLGECTDFPENFGENILSKLTKLEKLRLEKGQGNCYIFEMLRAVKDMKHLEQLELVNFDIKTGFDKALGSCSNIKKLLIIPTYISQSATTNHMVLGGVLRLQKSLSHFVWGVTLELLRVTELFVDQCEEPDKKDKKEKKPVGNGDSIPVLKPVPLIVDGKSDIPPAHDPPQVEILPLPNLQKLLLQSLPTTRVKILKIPFHATWRQSITDSAN